MRDWFWFPLLAGDGNAYLEVDMQMPPPGQFIREEQWERNKRAMGRGLCLSLRMSVYIMHLGTGDRIISHDVDLGEDSQLVT